ncbi:MAG: sel1 repeat family protein [Cardiobacteriaceae bacterium]|nr:sel1 repeat family protein [Cardiobacteriaceae bacterium]
MKATKLKLFLSIALAATSFVANAQDASSDLAQAAQAAAQGDKAQAAKHLQNAANKGDAVAQFNLGVAYASGDGVTANEKTAIDLWQKSAAQGYPAAQYELAIYYLDKKQASKAAPLLKSLADNGDPAAQYNYAMMLGKGDGVKKNDALALEYLQKSAAQGFPPALQATGQEAAPAQGQ